MRNITLCKNGEFRKKRLDYLLQILINIFKPSLTFFRAKFFRGKICGKFYSLKVHFYVNRNEPCLPQQFISERLGSRATAQLMLNSSSPLIYRALCQSRFITCWSHSFCIWHELNRIQCTNLPSVFRIYDPTRIKWLSSASVVLGEHYVVQLWNYGALLINWRISLEKIVCKQCF